MESQSFWLENLRRHKTLADLRRSPFFAEWGKKIEQFLITPQVIPFKSAVPRLGAFLRVAQWNIEKGKRFDAIAHRLQHDEILKWADIVILNEADYGMNRSGHRHIARDLADVTGMHAVFAPAHFELTKGTDDELTLDGENHESLQGNAILSRYPVADACVVQLPVTFEPYEFQEKRFGGRNCLWAHIQLVKRSLWVASTHLELRNTPQCRALQMRHIMEHLPGRTEDAYLLGGDLNTNTFRRGTAWRAMQSIMRLLTESPEELMQQLLHPERGREPLFGALARHGFTWEALNSYEETARAAINSLDESGFIPSFLRKALNERLRAYGGYFCFKLDWLLGKNVSSLSEGERRDTHASVPSLAPAVLGGENSGPGRISDHLPIYADIELV